MKRWAVLLSAITGTVLASCGGNGSVGCPGTGGKPTAAARCRGLNETLITQFSHYYGRRPKRGSEEG